MSFFPKRFQRPLQRRPQAWFRWTWNHQIYWLRFASNCRFYWSGTGLPNICRGVHLWIPAPWVVLFIHHHADIPFSIMFAHLGIAHRPYVFQKRQRIHTALGFGEHSCAMEPPVSTSWPNISGFDRIWICFSISRSLPGAHPDLIFCDQPFIHQCIQEDREIHHRLCFPS